MSARPRRNGDLSKPKWVSDDESDQQLDELGAKLAEAGPSPEETAASPNPANKTPKPVVNPSTTKTDTVNAKEIIDVIVQAYMASEQDRVSIEVDKGAILVSQILGNQEEGRIKTTWRIGISSYTVHQRKLIK